MLVSAITGEGLDTLAAAIETRLAAGRVVIELVLDVADGAGVSWLHRHTEVISKIGRREDRPHRHDGARRCGPGEGGARTVFPPGSRTLSECLHANVFAGQRLIPAAFASLPQRIHFGERGVLRRLAARGERRLDARETALEFLIGLPQQRFRIGVADGGRG